MSSTFEGRPDSYYLDYRKRFDALKAQGKTSEQAMKELGVSKGVHAHAIRRGIQLGMPRYRNPAKTRGAVRKAPAKAASKKHAVVRAEPIPEPKPEGKLVMLMGSPDQIRQFLAGAGV